jgi:hypothetical protein
LGIKSRRDRLSHQPYSGFPLLSLWLQRNGSFSLTMTSVLSRVPDPRSREMEKQMYILKPGGDQKETPVLGLNLEGPGLATPRGRRSTRYHQVHGCHGISSWQENTGQQQDPRWAILLVRGDQTSRKTSGYRGPRDHTLPAENPVLLLLLGEQTRRSKDKEEPGMNQGEQCCHRTIDHTTKKVLLQVLVLWLPCKLHTYQERKPQG